MPTPDYFKNYLNMPIQQTPNEGMNQPQFQGTLGNMGFWNGQMNAPQFNYQQGEIGREQMNAPQFGNTRGFMGQQMGLQPWRKREPGQPGYEINPGGGVTKMSMDSTIPSRPPAASNFEGANQPQFNYSQGMMPQTPQNLRTMGTFGRGTEGMNAPQFGYSGGQMPNMPFINRSIKKSLDPFMDLITP